MTKTQSIALATALALSPLSLLPAAIHHHSPIAIATDVCTVHDAYAREVGDDNCDGTIMEDESGWDCATMGNLICGPGVIRHQDAQLSADPNAYDMGSYVGGYN